MIDTEKFKVKTHNLKDIIMSLKPDSVSLEMSTYNFIIQTCEENNLFVDSGLNDIFKGVLDAKSLNELPAIVKEAKTEALYWKVLHKHDPAFIIVHGFNSVEGFDYMKHIGKFTKSDDLTEKNFLDYKVQKTLMRVAYEDGATIIDAQNKIFATHAHMINLNPRQIIKERYPESVRPGYSPDSSKYFGFRQDVNTRHLSALYASFHLEGSVIYTLGERIEVKDEKGKLVNVEDGHIRRYEKGLITFSTFDKEAATVQRSINIINEQLKKTE